jgi:hypothetical protein
VAVGDDMLKASVDWTHLISMLYRSMDGLLGEQNKAGAEFTAAADAAKEVG